MCVCVYSSQSIQLFSKITKHSKFMLHGVLVDRMSFTEYNNKTKRKQNTKQTSENRIICLLAGDNFFFLQKWKTNMIKSIKHEGVIKSPLCNLGDGLKFY